MASFQHDHTSHLPALVALLHQYTDTRRQSSPYETAIGGVSILRSDPVKQPSQCMIKPALCISIQGEKTATVGDRLYEYRAGHGLVVTIEMPECGTVCAASKTKPYLGLVLELNLQILQELVEERTADAGTRSKAKGAIAYTLKLNDELIDCALRAVRLLATPDAIPTLYPGIMREICYWLLRGPGDDQLRRIMVMTNG